MVQPADPRNRDDLPYLSRLDRPLFWSVFSTATTLWGDGSDALGFSYFFEFGAGLELELPDVPLIRVVRVRGSGIVGGNITGWTAGVSFAF